MNEQPFFNLFCNIILLLLEKNNIERLKLKEKVNFCWLVMDTVPLFEFFGLFTIFECLHIGGMLGIVCFSTFVIKIQNLFQLKIVNGILKHVLSNQKRKCSFAIFLKCL